MVQNPLRTTTLDSFRELHEAIQQAPHYLNLMCQIGGCAVVLNGLFSVLDVFEAFSHTIFYIVNGYLVFFGIVTIITESHPDNWPPLYGMLHSIQEWMHEWAMGLTMLIGRGLFYIFQGSLIILSSSLLSLGLFVGLYMMLVGSICVFQHWQEVRSGPREDYIRVR